MDSKSISWVLKLDNMTRAEKIDIVDNAIDLLKFHIGSSHSDTDNSEEESVTQLSDLLNNLT